MKNDNPYLNPTAVTVGTIRKHLLRLVGGFFTVIFTIALCMSITAPDMRQDWYVSVIVLVPSILLLRRGIRAGRNLGLARRYGEIFAQDQDGVVELAELAEQTGKPPERVMAELEELFHRGLFRDCRLQTGEKPGVVLSSLGQGEQYFTVVTCANCGAGNRMRYGSRGECEYCGSALLAPKSKR